MPALRANDLLRAVLKLLSIPPPWPESTAGKAGGSPDNTRGDPSTVLRNPHTRPVTSSALSRALKRPLRDSPSATAIAQAARFADFLLARPSRSDSRNVTERPRSSFRDLSVFVLLRQPALPNLRAIRAIPVLGSAGVEDAPLHRREGQSGSGPHVWHELRPCPASWRRLEDERLPAPAAQAGCPPLRDHELATLPVPLHPQVPDQTRRRPMAQEAPSPRR